VTRKSTSTFAVFVGLILAVTSVLAVTISVDTTRGYSTIPDGRGGMNVEATVYTKEMGFDVASRKLLRMP
jgi:hypothetical protein